MPQEKPKVLKTKVKDPNFIRFSEIQSSYLNEIISRHQEKFSNAVGLIYKELGIAEKISEAPPGTYQLRQDFSGLDVLPPPPDPPKDDEPLGKKPEDQIILKEKGGEDN